MVRNAVCRQSSREKNNVAKEVYSLAGNGWITKEEAKTKVRLDPGFLNRWK